MKNYYLYGAGINCIGVIKFLRKCNVNIIAVIDGDEKKHGKRIEGITIIPLEEYIQDGQNEVIIITAFYGANAIEKKLKQKKIYNYYKSPYMQNGFYDGVQDIVKSLKLNSYSKLAFATYNPISELISDEVKLKNNTIEITYIDEDNVKTLDINIPVIVTNEDDKSFVMQMEKNNKFGTILDINQIYIEQFAFENPNIKKFKNIHAGKRCFIIGNGSSLTYEDLEKLYNHKEICFGVNRIYYAYTHTNWRPDYYVAVDTIVVRNDYAKIISLSGIKFIRHFYVTPAEFSSEDIYEFRGLSSKKENPQLSWDIEKGIYIGNTVVYDAIQIALYMGFQEIYLLGVDMTSGIRLEDEGAHFYKTPNAKEKLEKGDVFNVRKNLGYAANEIEKSGRRLRNATRGGELEEVQRVNFDELF